jgi:hypothetical protein
MMARKRGFGGNPPMKNVTATKTGIGTRGVAKTGQQKYAQFQPKTPGQREVGFRQRTPKQSTAAMQGSEMPSGNLPNVGSRTRRDGRKQFGTPAGKRPF